MVGFSVHLFSANEVSIYVNGDAAESYRGQSVDEKSLFLSINESDGYLYRSAAEPAMCNYYLGLLFHMR